MIAQLPVNGLAVYPQLGLVLFLAVFIAVTVRACRRSGADVARWARMPLEDRPATTEPAPRPRGETR